MSMLTLANVNTFVRAHIPNYPQLNIGTHLNLVLEEVYERLQQVEYSTFTTVPPTESGTVSVTAGSTTATFSGSVLLTTDGLRLVQIGDDPTWYALTRNAADTAGVLSSKYAGTTNGTATYKIIYPTVSFAAVVGIPYRIWREGFDDLTFAPSVDPSVSSSSGTTGLPLYYAPYSIDTAATPDDAHRIILLPYPEDRYSFSFQYVARPTLVNPSGADSQTVPIPTTFRQAILYSTLALCWLGQDRESNPWEGKAEAAFRKAMAHGAIGSTGQRRGAYGSRHVMSAQQDRPA